ncbi:hypothetical protein TNCV_1609721 [Trichonephila clavipes]|nr:hypothetical protein TNCV_1609721 [Trichonephila clavipes]
MVKPVQCGAYVSSVIEQRPLAACKENVSCGSCQNQKPEQPPLLEITTATRLSIDSKRLWMCSWDTKFFQAASTRCQS